MIGRPFAPPLPFDVTIALGTPEVLPWRSLRPGVYLHWLQESEEGGPSAALLRYESGAEVPRHVHTGFEYLLILEGSQEDERGTYPVGTFVVNPPGSEHRVFSPRGCLVLAVWERPVRFVS